MQPQSVSDRSQYPGEVWVTCDGMLRSGGEVSGSPQVREVEGSGGEGVESVARQNRHSGRLFGENSQTACRQKKFSKIFGVFDVFGVATSLQSGMLPHLGA
jgi:hypothetical protein